MSLTYEFLSVYLCLCVFYITFHNVEIKTNTYVYFVILFSSVRHAIQDRQVKWNRLAYSNNTDLYPLDFYFCFLSNLSFVSYYSTRFVQIAFPFLFHLLHLAFFEKYTQWSISRPVNIHILYLAWCQLHDMLSTREYNFLARSLVWDSRTTNILTIWKKTVALYKQQICQWDLASYHDYNVTKNTR